MIKTILAVVISSALLTACLHEKDQSGEASADSLKILAVSGELVELEGTFVMPCRAFSDSSEKNTISITGVAWKNTWFKYTSTDCTGTVISEIYEGKVSAGETGAITGWTDSAGPASAPAAANGSGLLSDTESYTLLTATFTNLPANNTQGPVVGDTRNFFYIADDTGSSSSLTLYPDNDIADGDTTAEADRPLIK